MIERLSEIHPLLPPIAGSLALLIAALIVNSLVKSIVVRAVQAVAKKSRVTWDDALIRHNVIGRLAQLVPGLIAGYHSVQGTAGSIFVTDLACSDRNGLEPR